ncbi:MAG: site-specific DNA-methyltransferase, partial [Methanoregula sp.]|nr:site-specific DNA-methyltransferase [Methanoregula sp.]
MIYLDPPYGIKFNSNWQVSTRKREVKDGKADDTTRQPEQIRAFRDTWKLGIHSYLTYLRDRLTVIRDLLTDNGSVFIQIGNENLHLVRCLMDEVYGNENFCSIISFRKTTTQSGDFLPDTNDYIIWFAKDKTHVKNHILFQAREGIEWVNYDFIAIDNGLHRKMTKDEKNDPSIIPTTAKIYRRSPLTSDSSSSSTLMPVEYDGQIFNPGKGGWKTNETGFKRLIESNRLESYGVTLSYRRYTIDFPYFPFTNTWLDTASGGYGEDKIYVVQTNSKVIERCLLMTTDPGDIVLDPTCGSGTTAYVAEQWGRRWITIDTSRVALALARTRLMSARFPYYLLTDSPEGLSKEGEITHQRPPVYPTKYDIKKGFVYHRVPHITLKSIANNEEIDSIYEKYQTKLEPLLTSINKAAKKQWEEWEVPREVPENEKLDGLLKQWGDLRQQRQKEIDASIALRADVEMLYDQPYDDPKRVRVTGPFSVESLSPHRILPADENMDGTVSEKEAHNRQDFTTIILDNLRASGVDNRVKNERIRFASLDPFAGKWIHAKGTYTDAEGTTKSVAISIGPEHGTVGPLQVKEAAKEAVQRLGVDLLIVCGFAFDPHISDEM